MINYFNVIKSKFINKIVMSSINGNNITYNIIEAKILAKFDKYIFKKEIAHGNYNITCSICLENIPDVIILFIEPV